MAMRSYHLSGDGRLRAGLAEEEIRDAIEAKDGVLWLDLCGAAEDDGEYLARTFGFHRLAVEDSVSTSIHPPKIDEFDDHLLIIVHGINHMTESEIVETTQLAVFLGSHYVVSSHRDPLYSVDSVLRLVERDARPMRRGADFLAYLLIDALIDNIVPTIDRMGEVADEIEEAVIRDPRQSALEAIMKLKRSALRIHRVMAPQREVLNRLSRREFLLVRDEVQIFYRDVYDHIVRLEDMDQSLRDRADNALATHLSSVANRQNETMKILSTVATIFLPLALVAGIYGMNFEYMPELAWHWSYFAVVGFVGAAIVVVVSWFWARRWIAWSRRQVIRARPFAVEPEKLAGYIGNLRKRPHL
jgi:magnesium transporter